MSHTPRFAAAALAALALPTLAAADCASDVDIARYVADWQSAKPAAPIGASGSLEDALCTQDKLVERLAVSKGRVVGYKAGLTSEAAQTRFGVEEPVQGRLLEKMLLEDGARVPAAFGARPLFEADLLLVVGDEAINEASTPAEALAHIAAVRPFIELPDLAVAEGEPITGLSLTATNVAARLGVVGAEIAVDESFLERLSAMDVVVRDAEGAELARVKGDVVLGHPVNSLLWLLEKGVRLSAGDIVSVGSIGPLMPPAKAKGRASVTYEGLPGDPVVSVVFTD